jgi:hypothetical protein
MERVEIRQKVEEIEERLGRVERIVAPGKPLLSPGADAKKARAGAMSLIRLIGKKENGWKGRSSSVGEVRKMRKTSRGY